MVRVDRASASRQRTDYATPVLGRRREGWKGTGALDFLSSLERAREPQFDIDTPGVSSLPCESARSNERSVAVLLVQGSRRNGRRRYR